MNTKVLFCLIALLALSYCDKYTLYSFFDQTEDKGDWDLSSWQTDDGALSQGDLSTCGGESIVGGYKNFGKGARLKTKSPLAINYPHEYVWISFDFYAIDSWDPNVPDNKWAKHLDRVLLLIDGQKELIITKDWEVCDRPIQLCGRDNDEYYWKEYIYHFDIKVKHNSNDISVLFRTRFDQNANDESWGVQNLTVSVDFYCDDCGCYCPDGYFSDGNTCRKCFPNCKRCADWHTCLECEQDFTNGLERVQPNCWCQYEAEDVDGVCTLPERCPYGYSASKKAHEDKYECVKCADNCKSCTKWGTCTECKKPNRPSWNCDACIWGYEENQYGDCVKC